MSEITWGTSQQDRLTLILDVLEFQKKLETKTTTHWKCSKWSSYKCKVTAITTGKQLPSKKNEHNHEFIPGHLLAKQIIGQMKETARTEQKPINNMIIASSLFSIGSDIATQLSLSTRSAINRTLNRQKRPRSYWNRQLQTYISKCPPGLKNSDVTMREQLKTRECWFLEHEKI